MCVLCVNKPSALDLYEKKKRCDLYSSDNNLSIDHSYGKEKIIHWKKSCRTIKLLACNKLSQIYKLIWLSREVVFSSLLKQQFNLYATLKVSGKIS